MGHFFSRNLTSENSSEPVHQVFLKLYLMTGIKKRVRVTVWIFPEHDIFGPKNAKLQKLYQIFSLDFSEIFVRWQELKRKKK